SSKSVAVLRRVFDRLEVSARSYDSDFARIWKTFLTAKGESNQCIVGTRPCCHDDELATRPCAVCHRNSVIRIGHFSTPDFFAGVFTEPIQISVASSNKYQSALGNHSPAAAVLRTEPIGQFDPLQKWVVAYR